MAAALLTDLKPPQRNYPKRNVQLIEAVNKIKQDRSLERSLNKGDLKISS